MLSVGPLALLTYFSVTLSSDAVRHRVRESLSVEASIAAQYVRQELRGLAEVDQSFARRPVIVHALQRGPRHYDRATIRRNLVELSHVRPGIGTACLARLDGRLVDIVPRTRRSSGRTSRFATGIAASRVRADPTCLRPTKRKRGTTPTWSASPRLSEHSPELVTLGGDWRSSCSHTGSTRSSRSCRASLSDRGWE